jgi:hypothetical protein
MIRRGRWKLTYQPLSNGQLLQLFDVEADPLCKQNLIDQHGHIATMLWQTLCVWIGRVPEAASKNNDDNETKKPRSPISALAASDTQNNPQ